MGAFNSTEYLKDQIEKQYNSEVKTKHKNTLDFSSFQGELSALTEKKYNFIHELVKNQSIEVIQECLKESKFTYSDLIIYFIKRIKDNDYKYNSILYFNPKALIEAKSKVYNKNNHLLYGMPILVKGNIGVKGMPLTAGAAALKENISKRDSRIVENLKAKGAIILGQTNLSEFANYMTSNSSNGYSAIGGQTKNPFGTFDVGGSSAGSAVALDKNFAIATIGTETAGSIIYPSSQNGVIGLKPTLGSISQDMIIPISKTHDIPGPMTRNIFDQYILLDAIKNNKGSKPLFNEKFLRNKKIGVINNQKILKTYRKSDHLFLEALRKDLSSKGAVVETVELEENLFQYDISDILSYEFKDGINSFLKDNFNGSEINTLDKIIENNKMELDSCATYGQDLLENASNNDFNEKDISKTIREYTFGASKVFDKIFKKYDFLLTISNYMTTPYACSGNPAINFPIGQRDSGEPIGGTFIGRKNREVDLIDAVYAYLT